MKIKIKSVPNLFDRTQTEWMVVINGAAIVYTNSTAAYEAAKKAFKRFYKESAAFSMLSTISVNLLSVDEAAFVAKLTKSKCKGITKAQYGYLKGVHERQEREW